MIPERASRSPKSILQLALRAAISAVLLWLPLRHVALRAVIVQIAVVEKQAIAAALLALLAATFVAAMRWSFILAALKTPRALRITYPLSLIGIFFGQALPAGVGGDVVRAWLACKTGLTMRTAISSILGDRLAGLLAILIIVTIELPQLDAMIRSEPLFVSLLCVLAIGYGGLVLVVVLDRLPSSWQRFRVFRGFAAVSSDIRVALFSREGLPVLICGAVIQVLNVVAVFALAAGLHLPVTFLDCLLIVPFANVLQTIPISIAGWGVRESFFVAAFGLIGVATPSALAISVVFGLLIIVSSLPGGALWLLRGTGSPLRLREVNEPVVSSE